MKPQIFQKKYGEEYHTLYVFRSKDGIRITCECLSELYNVSRNHQAKCKHAKELLIALKENKMSGWKDVTA